MHGAQITFEIRSTGTDADGWQMFEPTGLACAVCPCGEVTGFIEKQDALQVYKDHGAGHPLAGPVLMGHTDHPAVRAHDKLNVDVGTKGGEAFRDLFQKITRA